MTDTVTGPRGQYGVVTLTPEQIEASRGDVGAFVRLREVEFNACLRHLQEKLYPPFIGPIRQPSRKERLRRWVSRQRWQARSAVGRPLHWLAQLVSPGGCGCEP